MLDAEPRGMSQPHESLIAWQRADDLCVRIYQVTQERFPRDEKHGLAAQTRRAGYSVAANIVEGFADRSNKWRLRYLRIALGSLAEVGYALHLARRLEYLKSKEYAEMESQLARVAAPLHGLIASVRADLKSGDG
jgi:four helix bundle protein